jgi:hypothetical protein
VRIGSATNYSYDLQTVGDDFQIIEAGVTPRLTIKYPSGDVGIGTTSPTNKLSISATGLDITGGNAINGTNMQGIRLQNTLNDNSSLGLWFGTNNVHWAGISGQRTNFAGDWTTDLRFYTHEAALVDVTYARERMRIAGNGSVTANVDFRAPIFYDSDNTARFVDPSSTSVLNVIRGATLQHSSGNVAVRLNGDTWTEFCDPNGATKLWLGGGDPNNYYNAGIHYFRNNSSGTTMTIDNAGNAIATASYRAPIFYDTNDTSRYLDPNGTSRINFLTLLNDEGLNVGGIRGLFSAGSDGQGISLFSNVDIGYPSGWGAGLGNTPSRGLSVYGGLRVAYSGGGFITSDTDIRSPIFYDSNNTGYYIDPASGSVLGGNVSILGGRNIVLSTSTGSIQIRGDAGGWSIGTLFYGSSGTYRGGFGALGGTDGLSHYWIGNDYNNAGLYVYPSNYAESSGSLRAPIFYDSNNTGYYVDPAGFSNMSSANGMWMCGTGNPADTVNGSTWYGTGRNNIGSGQVQLAGYYGILLRTASASMVVEGDYAQINGSYRAPIFYDSNDTAYYFDGTGGTRQSKFLTINGNIGGNNGNELVVGNNAVTYSLTDTNLRPVIQAHGAYPVLSLNHTITANTLHGPTVQFTANGTGKQFVIGMSGNGSQLDIGNSAATDWNPHNGIGGYNGITGWRMDGAGNVYNLISSRSPIYYDNDNTGFYIDPAGTSTIGNLRTGNVINMGGWNESIATSAFRGIEFHNEGGRDYYIGKPAGAWTQPLAITFYTGIHYRASQDYGGSKFFNANNGSMLFSIGDNDGSVRVTNDIRSPIYYDSNDTAFYMNPNAGSRFQTIDVNDTIYSNNWFRSYGSSGWFNQSYAGGIYMEDTTWVRVYNGKAFYVPNEIAATGNITAYYSDERLKTKTGDIDNALEKVAGLSGFLYVENDLARSLGYTNPKQQVGVSAQAVQAVLPEAVSLAPVDFETLEDGMITSKSGENYLTVDYSRLVPLLIEAIKELSLKVKTLEEKDN